MEVKTTEVTSMEEKTLGAEATEVKSAQDLMTTCEAGGTESVQAEAAVECEKTTKMEDSRVDFDINEEFDDDGEGFDKVPMVPAVSIYQQIMENERIPETARESYLRNLRNKLNFVIESVALRQRGKYKKKRNIMIPVCDAPIVRNLISASLDDNYPFIVDWFNGSLDLGDSAKCVLLGNSVKEPIMRAELMGETDGVTVDEWLAAINGLLNLNMAKGTAEMKNKLEEFRVNTLVMDSTVLEGDLTMSDGLGHRRYILQGRREKSQLSEDILDKIVQDLSFQQDYFDVLDQIMDYMMKDAEKKAIPYIETYASVKALTECDSAQKIIGTDDGSMVSEYFPWLKKIGAYLKSHPEEAARIEKSVGTTGLIDFFN